MPAGITWIRKYLPNSNEWVDYQEMDVGRCVACWRLSKQPTAWLYAMLDMCS